MKSTDVFPSKYLKAEELDEDVQVTIKKVVLEELEDKQGQKQDKPVCYFEEGPKGLILNKTNWALIAKQHGDESDEWIGKKVTLTTVDVDAFGDVVSAIRIKPPKKQSGGSAFPKAPEPAKQVDRPLAADTLRAFMAKKSEKHIGHTCSDAQFGLAMGMLNECFAREEDSDNKRHSVIAYLFNADSGKKMLPEQVLALLDWLKPEKDSGGAYLPDPLAVKEAQAVVRARMIELGNEELFPEK